MRDNGHSELAPQGAVHGGQAGKPEAEGEIREPSYSVLVENKGSGLTASGSQGQDETPDWIVVRYGFPVGIRRTNIRASRFGCLGSPPIRPAFSFAFVRPFVKLVATIGFEPMT